MLTQFESRIITELATLTGALRQIQAELATLNQHALAAAMERGEAARHAARAAAQSPNS